MAVGVPKKKARKRSGSPTQSSIDAQTKRLDRAREATKEANEQHDKARAAERDVKRHEIAIGEAQKLVKTLRSDVVKAKIRTKSHDAKAKVLRAKASKLAKPS